MPYDIKRNYGGCKGYAVVGPGGIKGCHTSRSSAVNQQRALYAAEADSKKSDGIITNDITPKPYPSNARRTKKPKKEETQINKEMWQEGMFVMGESDGEMVHGKIEHVMRDGSLGPGSKFEVQATMEDPALLIRIYDEEDGVWEETAYFTGLKSSEAMLIGTEEDMRNHSMEKADSVRVGQMVSWNSSGGRAEGKVIRIIRNGKYNVPNSSFEITGTPEDPAVAIRVYRDGKPTDRTVGHRMSTLRVMSKIQKMWSIKENVPGCAGYALVDDDGELERCFSSRDEAERVMQEHNRKERLDDMNDNDDDFDDDDMSKRNLEDLDLRPTESMANNARRGLELRRKFGRGGTAVGVARARDLANRKELSPETVARMYSFFSRHEVDKKGKDWNNSERPSNGKIAWLLWGGDSGYAWSRSKWNAIQRIRAQKSNSIIWENSALNLRKNVDN